MAIGKISGTMLQTNLERQGVDLAIEGNIFYADVTNRRIGVGTASPAQSFDVPGNVKLANLTIAGNDITSNTGKIGLGSITGLIITGGLPYYIPYTDGYGNLNWGNLNTLSVNENFYANSIQLGANAAGALSSNAVVFTATSNVTDSIAQMNYVLGKLVPPSPPAFPGANVLALTSATTSALMCSFVQTDNTGWANANVAGGTLVAAVRSAAYTTGTTISAVGPGNSGTVTAYLNGVAAGSTTLTGSSNGTYGNLIIANNQDYHNVVAAVTGGFWYSFDARAAGNAPAGWNAVWISDSATGGSTNAVKWYYDNSAPATPAFSATSMVLSSNTVTYSSTIPHLNSSAGFTLKGNVTNLSGDMYPNSTNLFSTTAGSGPFSAPPQVTYTTAGVTTPLGRSSTAIGQFTTTSNIGAGFGSALSTVGPSVSVTNSYNTGTQTFPSGNIILYKTGTANALEETSISIGAVGTGSGSGYRIVNPDGGVGIGNNTPTYGAGAQAAFNAQTGPFYVSDTTVVAGSLKYDITNYSTGYLPVGPNLVTQNSVQYFTFKFVRSAVQKFNISFTGSCSGVWIALPGSTIDTSSSLNGWLDATAAYGGSGIPGANSPGNGSNGCNVGGFSLTGGSYTVSFGTVSSSSTATNAIFVRFRLTSGQSISALSIAAATN